MEEADRLLGPEVGDADGNNEPRNFHPSSRVKYRPLASSPMRRTRPSSGSAQSASYRLYAPFVGPYFIDLIFSSTVLTWTRSARTGLEAGRAHFFSRARSWSPAFAFLRIPISSSTWSSPRAEDALPAQR